MTWTQTPDGHDWRADRVGSALRGENPAVLRRLPGGFAVMGDVQFLPGYCVLITDTRGADRLTDLPRQQRLAFLDSMELLGRYEWEGADHVWRPVALHPIERWRAPEPETVLGPQHDDLRAALTTELDRLSARRFRAQPEPVVVPEQ